MRALVLLVLPLFACAMLEPLTPGVSHEPDVQAMFGAPAAERRLADGSRVLEFPREPEGMQNWRVTLGPDGTVRAVEQLVDEPYFAKVQPGMARDDVVNLLGRFSEETHYRGLGEDVLSWRYLEFGQRVMYFNAHFDGSGRLKYASRTIDRKADPAQNEM